MFRGHPLSQSILRALHFSLLAGETTQTQAQSHTQSQTQGLTAISTHKNVSGTVVASDKTNTNVDKSKHAEIVSSSKAITDPITAAAATASGTTLTNTNTNISTSATSNRALGYGLSALVRLQYVIGTGDVASQKASDKIQQFTQYRNRTTATSLSVEVVTHQ